MIKLVLSGGLGNQMFQYAAAKSLALRLGADMYIDTYSLIRNSKTVTCRKYELDIFGIKSGKTHLLSSKFFVKSFPLIHKYRQLFYKLGYFTDKYSISYQKDFEFISNKNIHMFGYFQNTQYFENIAATLRSDFTFKRPLNDQNLDISEKIDSTNSVAIHIRHGDYQNNKNATFNFAICDLSYYKDAINYVMNRANNPTFYIFSDDPDWVKENIRIEDHSTYYIDWNKGNNSYIDMQLMSLCKHNITANSTFSWWAAWLNNNPDKIVVVPSNWFLSKEKNELLKHFYPKEWIKI